MSDDEKPKDGGDFAAQFNARLDRIEADAGKAGIPMKDVCAAAGVSRATPSRWRRQTPETVQVVDRLEAGLKAALAKKVAAPSTAS